MAANRSDWKKTPLPARHERLTLDRTYDAEEFARICEGMIARAMEAKWFALFEEPWLYVHRSWTGFYVYRLRFADTEAGAHVSEALVSRDPEQYTETDSGRDRLVLADLLNGLAGRSTEVA